MRAILHRPAGGAPRGAFLFLGGWSGDRQGPHRLFLLFARRLAAADLRPQTAPPGGLGQATGRPGADGHLRHLTVAIDPRLAGPQSERDATTYRSEQAARFPAPR